MNEHLGETPSKTIENCQPGDVFKLVDASNLQAFEDEVAERFTFDEDSADIHYETWNYRKKLLSLIRPDDYYGPIKNITLTVIPDAYDRMFDLKTRGRKYPEYQHPKVRTKFVDEAKKSTIGFDLTAETKKGLLCTEVYYVPIAENSTSGKRATSNTGGVINRYYAAPNIIPYSKIEKDDFAKNPVAVGAVVVRQCVSNLH